MMFALKKLVAILFALIAVGARGAVYLNAAFGATYYVATNGTDEATAGTAESPFATLHYAVSAADAAIAGGEASVTINVAKGTYLITKTTGAICVTNPISIIGEDRDTTIVSHESTTLWDDRGRVFDVSNAAAVLRNLTIKNGFLRTGDGLGVRLKSGLVEDCRISGNQGGGGLGCGIYIGGTNSRANRCIIHDNRYINIGGGGGAAVKDGGVIENSLVYANRVTGSTAATGEGGGGIMSSGKGFARNCTIVGNSTTLNVSGGIHVVGGTFYLTNCIVWGNFSEGLPKQETYGEPELDRSWNGGFSFNHCAIPASCTNGYPNCITDDPNFTDAANHDYTLKPSSKLINRGIVVTDIGQYDLAGEDRVSGDAIDIGCYEADSETLRAAIGFSPSSQRVISGRSITLYASLLGDATATSYAWIVMDAGGASHTSSEAESVFTIDAAGPCSVSLTIGTTVGDLPVTGTFMVEPQTICVETNAVPAFPYDTQANAFTNIAEAVAYAIDGMRVLVGDGRFDITKQIEINRAVTVESRNGYTASTVYQVKHNSRLFYLMHADSVVRGFTITGANNVNQAAIDSHGVGARVNAGLIECCRITGNAAFNWCVSTGVYLGGVNAKVSRCIIDDNHNGANGKCGGLYMAAGIAENCLINGNSSSPIVSNGGGGVSIKGGALGNSTVVGNSAKYHGGGILVEGGSVKNCIFQGNTIADPITGGDGEPDWFCSSESLTNNFYNCDMPVAPNATCITNDPCFTDAANADYTITKSSPVRNRGLYDASWMDDALDLAGNPRVDHKNRVDIGCYEVPYVEPGSLIMVK